MKYFCWVLIICGLPLRAQADESPAVVALSCDTPWPTASVNVETVGDTVQMKVTFHYGAGRIPLKVDSVTSDDYPLLQNQLELLKKLDRYMVFEWDTKNCTAMSSEYFRCSSGRHHQGVGATGLKIDSVSFYSVRSTEKQYVILRDRYVVELTLNVGTRSLRISLPYDFMDCRFQPQGDDSQKHYPLR